MREEAARVELVTEVLDVVGLLLFVLGRAEKVRRRQLHFVADDDDLAGAMRGRNGVFQWDLARFVEDNDIETVRAIREAGMDAVYGDATRPETLIEAGIESAGNLILTSAGMANSTEVIRTAREANPAVRVLSRASYLRASLKAAFRPISSWSTMGVTPFYH